MTWHSGRVQIAILGPLEVRDDGRAGRRSPAPGCAPLLDPPRPRRRARRSASAPSSTPSGATQPAGRRDQRAADAGVAAAPGARRRRPLSRSRRPGTGWPSTRDDVDAAPLRAAGGRGRPALRAGDPAMAAGCSGRRSALAGRAPADAGSRGAARPAARSTDAAGRRGRRPLRGRPATRRGRGVVRRARGHWPPSIPLHERLAAPLIRALAAAGRQAEALRAYERRAGRGWPTSSASTRRAELQERAPGRAARRARRPAGRPRRAARRTNLKAQLTSFVGREDEVARIGKPLEQTGWSPLVGPGGAGKTRLAPRRPRASLDRRPTASGWSSWRRSPTGRRAAGRARLRSACARPHLLERRAPASAARRARPGCSTRWPTADAVLVLDNCEHLIEAAAPAGRPAARRSARGCGSWPPAASRWASSARRCSPCRRWASRARRRPPAEAPRVPGRPAVRRPGRGRAPGLRRRRRRPSARSSRSCAAWTGCRWRSSWPRPGCARCRSTEIAARLSDRFRLLTGGSRTALPRHRTLRAVVEWSWDLLTRRTSGAWPSGSRSSRPASTAASAAAVCADVELAADDVADLLASLIDKSLLQPVGDGRPRAGCSRPSASTASSGWPSAASWRAVRAPRTPTTSPAVLAEAEPHLTSAEQLPWFALLAAERDNILAAMRFRCDIGDADGALRIAIALGRHRDDARQPRRDRRAGLADALAVPGGDRTRVCA